MAKYSPMRFRAVLLTMLVFLLTGVAGLLPSPRALAGSGATVVGEDVSGDWNDGVAAPLGDSLGQDLVKATIGMKGNKTVVFGIVLDSLPAGEQPATGYSWNFAVGGKEFALHKHLCSPTAGTCPSRATTFNLMVCTQKIGVQVHVESCEPVASIESKVDRASATIAIPVPLDALKARPGDVISRSELPSLKAYVPPSVTLMNFTPLSDVLTVTKTFTIPKARAKRG